jgi:hypothetical protein
MAWLFGKGPEQGFFSRHSVKPKGEDKESSEYPGISEKGVEKARERAKELLTMIENAPAGAVMLISGGSELVRTKSTGEVYGEGLRDLAKGRSDLRVITREEIQTNSLSEWGAGMTDVVESIASEIKANPDKKFVIDFPLFMKGMTAAPFFNVKTGELKPYFKALDARFGSDEYAQLRHWIDTDGAPLEEGGEVGPSPSDIARGQEESMQRLRAFAERQIGNRPLIVGLVGHSWAADAFLLQAARGKIDAEGLDTIADGKGLIDTTELGTIALHEGIVTVTYRGNKYSRTLEEVSTPDAE